LTPLNVRAYEPLARDRLAADFPDFVAGGRTPG